MTDSGSTATATTKHIAHLETINTNILEALSSKNSYIAMLEERLLKISVELASSRACEDEQNLMCCQSTLSQSSLTEDVDSLGQTRTELIDDSIGSYPVQRSSSSKRHPRFSFMSSWGSKSDDLRVDFPAGGRRSTMVDECSAATESSSQNQRRTGLGQLFRPRISFVAVDEAAIYSSCSCEHGEPLRRKTNPRFLRHQSSRIIGSTVLFPMEDDDYSLGFE